MKSLENDYSIFLAHHGIKGQKWGVRNGPPYPLSSAKSAAVKKKASSGPRAFGGTTASDKTSIKRRASAAQIRADRARQEAETAHKLAKKYTDAMDRKAEKRQRQADEKADRKAERYQKKADRYAVKQEMRDNKEGYKEAKKNTDAFSTERKILKDEYNAEKYKNKVKLARTNTGRRLNYDLHQMYSFDAEKTKAINNEKTFKNYINQTYGPAAWERLEKMQGNRDEFNSKISRSNMMRNFYRSQASFSRARSAGYRAARESNGNILQKGKTYFNTTLNHKVLHPLSNKETTMKYQIFESSLNPFYSFSEYGRYMARRKGYPKRQLTNLV